MSCLSQISNYYYRATRNLCLKCLLCPVETLLSIIISTVKFIFQILQWGYEKVRYTSEERANRALDRRFKNELKKAFLQLGFMNTMVNMDEPQEIFDIIHKSNQDAPLLKYPDAKNKISVFCRRYAQDFSQKHLIGMTSFQEMQDAIKACAQKSQPGTTLEDESHLCQLLWQQKEIFISPLTRNFNNVFVCQGIMHFMILEHFEAFKTLFEENIPTS